MNPIQHPGMGRFICRLCVAILAGWAVFNLVHTARQVIGFYTPLPVRDYWQIVENLPDYQAFHLSVLWKQHNDHRIVIPEIVFAADMLLGHALMRIPLFLSSIAYVGAWLILSRSALSEKCIPSVYRLIAVLLASVLVFFESVTMVLAAPFLLQWTLVQLFVVLSLYFFGRFKETDSTLFFAATIATATAASFSSLNGLVLWPMLIFLAVTLRANLRHMVMLNLAGVANFAIYFSGYQIRADSNFWTLFVHPFYALEFIAAYISLPFGSVKAPAFAICLGFANITLALGLFVYAKARDLLSAKARILLFGYYAFSLFSGLCIAAGRFDVADGSFFSARSVRYISIPQMNWGVLILIALFVSLAARKRRVLFATVSLFFTIGFLFGFAKLDRWFFVTSASFQNVQRAAAGIERGEPDRELVVHDVYPDFNAVMAGLAQLRKNCLSVYYLSCRNVKRGANTAPPR